jgi:hypothetical protein
VADISPKLINVVNPSGKLVTLPDHQVEDAVSNGYSIPSASEEAELKDQAKFGDTAGALKTYAANTANTLSFGGTNQILTKSGAVDPSTLTKLNKYNPNAAIAGDVTGAIIPALATDGASLAAEGAEGASGILGAVTAPMRAVSKVGSAVTEAATPLAKKVAGLVVNPETSPMVHGILSSGAAHFAGSAVEGAAFGMGQSVSEEALGDPELNAQKLMSNIGYSALLGGGLGAALGAGSAAFRKAIPTVRDTLDSAGVQAPKDFESTVRLGAGEDKQSVLDGLKKLKPNVSDISTAADELNVPTFAGQVSSSDATQKAWSMLSQSPTHFGVAEKQAIDQAMNQIQGHIGEVFSAGNETAGTLAETGDKIGSSLTDKLAERYAPIKQAYSELKDAKADINLNESDYGKLRNAIQESIVDNKFSRGTAGRKLLETWQEGIGEMHTLADLQDYTQTFWRETNAMEKGTQVAAASAKAKVDGVVDGLIKNLADKIQDPAQKAMVEGLTDKLTAARAGYKGLVGDMEELGSVLGKNRVGGPDSFIDFLKELGPEKMADKLFQKKNSRFIESFSQKYPEEWGMLKGYQRNKIFTSNLRDGQFNLNGSLKEVYRYEPELRRAMFDDAELRKLSAAKTYVEAFPKNFNPSGTATGLGWMSFLSNPASAAVQHLRDFGLSKGFKSITESVGNSQSVQQLATVERLAQKTSGTIAQLSKSIFNSSPNAVNAASAHSMNTEKHEDTVKMVDDLANNPDKMLKTLEASTASLHLVAPQMAGGVHMAAVRATSFLSSKVPKNPNVRPMSGKFVPSAAEVSKFNRYYQTIQSPTHVLHGIKTGMIMPEHMEALAQVYPSLLTHMQSEVMDQMTSYMAKNEGNTLPMKTRMALSMFLGTDLDPALSQQSIASNQALMTGQRNSDDQLANPVQPSQSGMKNLSQDTRMMTASQSLIKGDDA